MHTIYLTTTTFLAGSPPIFTRYTPAAGTATVTMFW